MSSDWAAWLSRWIDAGLVDPGTAERIRAFEAAHAGSHRLRWPIVMALGFGALMIGGGILLFVAANWDTVSPAGRFALVLGLVSIFHVAGAVTAGQFRGMSEALHAIGTVALGAGIALSGQIFHLDEHWPAGIMLWAAGAGAGWLVLRHAAQFALFATLVPTWLIGEWVAAVEESRRLGHVGVDAALEVAAAGTLLLALTYLTAVGPEQVTRLRRTLMWIGGIALPVAAIVLPLSTHSVWPFEDRQEFTRTWVIGWSTAFIIPLLLSAILRGKDAWPIAVAASWVAVLVFVPGLSHSVAEFGWWGLGAIGLVAWGVRDGRVERINLGAAGFAVTVLAFYFSRVMDKLGRSAFLLILGLLFLGGGWALERIRRRLVERSREGR
jgi:Predicted membrane protein (DUF2157)